MGETIYRRNEVKPGQAAVYFILEGKVGFFESVGQLPRLHFQEEIGRRLSGPELESGRGESMMVKIQVHGAPSIGVDKEMLKQQRVEDVASR